ncbi:PREDICTED: disintegrin and metalloproteinase domain-containing protein 32-like [Pygoscelis adeliae]|uniref:disintegrin and metalloproteinase domain-containing protein 32-like n=1 Tax=Pygoscelis adeliae TaxID=9238 RepID=UPI0004F4DA0D|nr:PREDICTED: disintegrin and metalloproteinase domain-containing protein 32-like [Pygoscelis adeliae]
MGISWQWLSCKSRPCLLINGTEESQASGEGIKQPVSRFPRYLEMHAVLDKALYDYMGADKDAVTAKIVQLFSYVNSMFARLNLTIVLSSLEFWTENNKIPTTGDAEELLQRFLQWKNVHRVLRLQDIMFLFVYREQSRYVGACSARKLCLRNRAGGVALYRRAMTLEAFAVVVAQLLGLSLGMAYNEPGSCHCAGAICECRRDLCCTIGCKMRRGAQCLSGPCCRKCQFVKRGTLCRSSSEDECELKEYCNGTSGECTPDLWVMDGHPCSRNTAFCYQGVCQTADKQCQKVFGQGARNGPLACYEEINGQRDRMGHCGSNRRGYQHCAWKDLRCGKLVCEYLGSKPFTKEKAAVIYARVQNTLCVTLDYMKPPTERDPMLVNDGTVCDDHKICLNQQCVPATVLNYKYEADVGSEGSPKLWLLLTFCLFVPVAVGLILMALRRSSPRRCPTTEELDEDK